MEGATPWLQLALYVTLQQGPPSLVLPAGQRLWRLPACLEGAAELCPACLIDLALCPAMSQKPQLGSDASHALLQRASLCLWCCRYTVHSSHDSASERGVSWRRCWTKVTGCCLSALAGCRQALVWPWAPAAVRAEAVPALTDGAYLLAHLNEALTRTALLVQPLRLGPGVRRSGPWHLRGCALARRCQ